MKLNQKYRGHVVSMFALLILTLPFIFRPFVVTGGSMEPTYSEGDIVLAEKLTPHLRIWRGEVLVIRNPHDEKVTEIKRVVGLPGEIAELGEDGVTITDVNGAHSQFGAGTVVGGTGNGAFKIQLGPEDYMVLGDNRSKSSDSRSFGAVQKLDIIGRVIMKL